MQLQQIKIALAYESSTNPRGKDFAGPAFDDLVASVKEKGVLVPVIARPKAKDGKKFEIVAGNRRFRAAKLAGLDEIPARIDDLNDAEAREVQIIENLHREDVHPLDEGNAYRELIEKGKLEVESVAARTAKSVAYVRQRLHLTNLGKKAAAGFRSGKLSAGHAVLIARLEEADQEKALRFMSERRRVDLTELREWIQELTFRKLSAAPPWKNHEAAVAAFAPCADCTKRTGPTLFGEKEAAQCGDPTCFGRKLAAHLEIVKADFKKRGEALALVAGGWVSNHPKGVLKRDNYRKLFSERDTCKSEQKALIVAGEADDGVGEIIRICCDKSCSVHGSRPGTVYRLKQKEIARRKAAIKREKAKKEAAERGLVRAIGKVGWPLSEGAFNILLEVGISRGTMVIAPVCRRRGIKPKVTQQYYDSERKQGFKSTNWEKPLREAVTKMSRAERAQLLIEIVLVDHSYSREKLIKLL